MARECKGICKNEYVDGERVFSKKRLPYKKASWCSTCRVSVFPPSVNKIVVTISNLSREEFPDKIAVTCPCCWSVCRGGPLSKTDKSKAKRKTITTLKTDEYGWPEVESKKVKYVKPADKQTAKQENTISDSIKIKQFEDELKRLKTYAEYERDPSLWRDDIKIENMMVRPEAESTLDDVERESKKLYGKAREKVMERLTNGNDNDDDETERQEG